MPPTEAERRAYDELQAYTLQHGGPDFIHQHVVDAWAAQHAGPDTQPIALAFALVGLHLRVEHGWTGRRVQRAHMQLARKKRDWPTFPLPAGRGQVTAATVMAAPPGPERDREIGAWCQSVWDAYADGHRAVAELLRGCGVG